MSVPSIAFYPPLPPSAHLRAPLHRLPFPLEEPGAAVFSRGRHALWQAVRALRLAPGDGVLAPAWHHGAEVEALRRAGLALAFYELGEDLAPDPEELDALAGPRTRALLLTHYLGFPQDAARWRAWCDERGLLLIEDAAHALLATTGGRPAGAYGDAAIWCLFKTFPVSDGAALHLRDPAPRPDPQHPLGGAALVRRHAAWALQRAPALARVAGRPGGGRPYDPAAEVALGDPGTPPTAATARLLPRVADERAGARRRAHYEVLLGALGDRVPEPFARLPDGAVPLGLPLRARDKPALLARLAAHGVDGVDLWADAHPLAARGTFPRTAERRATTVVLPVHQELRERDLERLVRAAGPPRRPAPELTVERAASPDALRGEWDALAQRAGSVFGTPEWVAAWCRHFLGDRRLELLAFRDAAGRLVGVLAAYVVTTRPLKVLRVAGHGPGDELGAVCAAADRARVGRAVLRALDRLGARALLAEHVPRPAGWGSLAGARVLAREGSPVVRLEPADWDGWLARHSRNLRKEVRRQERRLRRDHDLRYRLFDGSGGEAGAAFEQLMALHRARWAGGETTFARHAAFHREFTAEAARRGWLRLWLAEAGGRPVAASYGLRFAGIENDYQGGRDPAWRGPSLGFSLQAHAIRAALEDGVREYRLLRGSEPYKYRFADEDPGLETVLVARGPVASAAAAAGAALPEPLSALVRRRLR